MSTEGSHEEPRRSTIVSRSPGMAYARMRAVRRTHFGQPLWEKLRLQGWLFAALAAALTTVTLATAVGRGSGAESSIDVVGIGAGGGALVGAAVLAHAAVGTYRLRREPLTEREALALLAVEDAGSYLGIATGGLLVAATVAATAVGLLAGTTPTGGSAAVGAALATGAAAAAAIALGAGRYFRGRLPRRS